MRTRRTVVDWTLGGVAAAPAIALWFTWHATSGVLSTIAGVGFAVVVVAMIVAGVVAEMDPWDAIEDELRSERAVEPPDRVRR